MDNALHRHDITDRSWEIIAPHLPGKLHDRGGTAKDNRLFINAVIKVHVAVPAHGMPVRVLVTAGAVADCTVAPELLNGFTAEEVIADKGYDSQGIVELIEHSGAKAVIPPRKNRKFLRKYDVFLYTIRHLVENAIGKIKEWRAVATRYAKRSSSFLAIVQICCAFQWLKIL